MPLATYRAVLRWAHEGATRCTEQELEALKKQLETALAEVRNSSNQQQQIADELDAVAKKLGFKSTQAMLKATRRTTDKRFNKRDSAVWRRPYMNPLQSPPTTLYTLPKPGSGTHHKMPQWADQLMNDPDPNKRWRREDFRYDNLALAAKAHGIELTWDPVSEFERLKAAALAKSG